MNSRQFSELFTLQGAYPELQQLVSLRKYTQQFSLDTVLRTSPSAGNWQSRMRGRGLDFAEVRLYQPADDIRSIDWRVTAKTQKTHTRLFTQERERPVILAADLRSAMFFGSTQCFKAVSCAAIMSALAWIALQSKDRVGGLVLGDNTHMELRPKASRKVVLSFIRYLDTYCQQLKSPIPNGSVQSMDQLLMKLNRVARPGSAVYLASDFHDIATLNIGRLAKLSQHSQVTLIMISDPLEWQLPTHKNLWVSDGLQMSELNKASRCEHILAQRTAKLNSICDPLNIEILAVSTNDNLLSVLQQRFAGDSKRAKSRSPT